MGHIKDTPSSMFLIEAGGFRQIDNDVADSLSTQEQATPRGLNFTLLTHHWTPSILTTI